MYISKYTLNKFHYGISKEYNILQLYVAQMKNNIAFKIKNFRCIYQIFHKNGRK